MTNLEDVADSPAFVLPIYGLVLIPLGLYVYHDIVDKRWRTIRSIVPFLVGYLLLYIFTAAALTAYIVIQAKASDFKEVGAAVLALVVGSHKLWTLIRLIFIIRAHHQIVQAMAHCRKALHGLLHGEISEDQGDIPRSSQTIHSLFEVSEDQGDPPRFSKISSSLFDEDYPGDSSRIKWIAVKATVHQDDQKEFLTRLAIWMRLAFFPHHNSIWHLLRNLQPLHKDVRFESSLLSPLKFVAKHAERPRIIQENPAEILLNAKELVKYLKKRNKSPQDAPQARLNDAVDISVRKFAKIGAALFWSVTGLREEETSQIIAEMPVTWLANTSLSGKELIYDIAIIVMLIDVPPCADRFGNSLKGILGLKSSEIRHETLEFWRDDWEDRWNGIFDVCGESIASLMTAYTFSDYDGRDARRTRIHDETKTYMEALLTMVEKEEKLGTARLRAHLMYMIREAYYAACVTLNVLGKDLDAPSSVVDEDAVNVKVLYQADIVFGLFSLLVSMGKCVDENNILKADEWMILKEGAFWTQAPYGLKYNFHRTEPIRIFHYVVTLMTNVAHEVYRALQAIASEVKQAHRSEEIQNYKSFRDERFRRLYGKERAHDFELVEVEHTLLPSELQHKPTKKQKCDNAWELSWLDPATERGTPTL